jgi:hypothetical protein
MYSFFRSPVPTAGLVLFAVVFGDVNSAKAQREVWEGTDAFQTTTSTFFRGANGRWTEEVVPQFGIPARYTFAENGTTSSYIELYDVTRNCYVRLYDNRADVKNNQNDQWVTFYTGSWVDSTDPALPGPETLQVELTHMFVIDDKESGVGEWAVKASINGQPELRIIESAMANSTMIVPINYGPIPVGGPTVVVTVTLYERDSSWQRFSSRTLTLTVPGQQYQFVFDSPQGRVIVYATLN